MKNRTALITAGLVAALVLAGAIAIGTNLSILDAAAGPSVGELSASGDGAPAANPGQLDQDQGKGPRSQTQEFIAHTAGTVNVTADETGLRLTDVSTNHGWKWKLVQSSDRSLTVTFASSDTTYKFIAKLGADGRIEARLDEPVTRVAAPSTGASTPRSGGTTSWQLAPTAPQPTSHSGYRDDEHDDRHDESHEHYEREEHDDD